MSIEWQIINSTDKLNIGYIIQIPLINQSILLPSGYDMMIYKIESVGDDIMKLSNENYIITIRKI